MHQQYGKLSTALIIQKKSFFDENEKHIIKQREISKVYIRQSERKLCKNCGKELSSISDFTKDKISYKICSICTHLNGSFEDSDEFCEFVMSCPEITPRAAFDQWERSMALESADTGHVSIDTEMKNPWKTMLAGAIAGAVSRTATAPLDRLKVLLQSGATAATSIRKGLVGIYREGGYLAFYRGNGANIIKIAPETATKFLAFDKIKHAMSHDPERSTFVERFVAGSCAGVLSQTIVYPLEITKTRLAVAPYGHYHGVVDCLKQVIKVDGLAGLSRGLLPSVLGIIPYAGVDLAVYSSLKDWYVRLNPGSSPTVPILLACGAISSTTGQLVAYPFQLVRTKLQSQGVSRGHTGSGLLPTYSGMFDCFKKVVATDGFFGLYRGLSSNFAKAIPAISISYAVYETMEKQLGN